MASQPPSRRRFLKTISAGSAAFGLAAASRARILGANDRISIAIIGCGDRGREAHMRGVQKHAEAENIEITALCDPWRLSREKAQALTKEWYGREARTFVTYRDVVALRDVDAVMIASCDHQHTTHLEAAARAKKDAYVEKPLAMTLDSLKAACDAVRENGCIVQVGTQLRSFPSFAGCREVVRSGVLGAISRIEQCRNGSRPYWYAYLKDAREEDVDWREFLMDRPMRPFRADVFTGWYGYREFSGGPVPGLGSHFIDLVHYLTGARFPASAVAHGGIFTWKDEHGFTCPDQVQATWVYPEGFLVSYSTNFGNGAGNSFKLFAANGVLDMVDWSNPAVSGEGGFAKGGLGERRPVEPVERPDHFLDWLRCLRTREDPIAPIEAGYQHAVAVILADTAYATGRRQVYDPVRREIREG